MKSPTRQSKRKASRRGEAHKWSGLWFEPETEHISRFNYGPTYRRLTGFARRSLGLTSAPSKP